MDPIALATVTSSVVKLATDVARGAANEAGGEAWFKIRNLLGWKDEAPEADELAQAVAEELAQHEEVASRVVELLQENASQIGASGSMVRRIDAENVVIVERQDIEGGAEFDLG